MGKGILDFISPVVDAVTAIAAPELLPVVAPAVGATTGGLAHGPMGALTGGLTGAVTGQLGGTGDLAPFAKEGVSAGTRLAEGLGEALNIGTTAGGILEGAGVGAGLGAMNAGLSGGNPLLGAELGGASGGISSGVSAATAAALGPSNPSSGAGGSAPSGGATADSGDSGSAFSFDKIAPKVASATITPQIMSALGLTGASDTPATGANQVVGGPSSTTQVTTPAVTTPNTPGEALSLPAILRNLAESSYVAPSHTGGFRGYGPGSSHVARELGTWLTSA